MARETLRIDQWHAIYNELVTYCGASELSGEQTDFFLRYVTRSNSADSEWRFGGWLGFGGKLYSNSQGVYVDCYSEDKSSIVAFVIKIVNERIAVVISNA